MKYISVSQLAKRWNLSERTIRNYCALGKINGAFLTGKTWNIPEDATIPEKGNKKKFSDNTLLNYLKVSFEAPIVFVSKIKRVCSCVSLLPSIRLEL